LFSHIGWLNGHDNFSRALGPIAVDAFFVLSGFLITGSWFGNRSSVSFWIGRITRLWPAYIACLMVTAFIVGPISQIFRNESLDLYFTSGKGPFSYVYRNLTLIVSQSSISGTPSKVPVPGDWNIPLWTLKYELLTYGVIWILGVTKPLESKKIAVGIFLTLSTIDAVSIYFGGEIAFLSTYLRFILLSFSGLLLWLSKDIIKFNILFTPIILAYCVAIYFFVEKYRWITNIFALFVALPFGILVLLIANKFPVYVKNKMDISYGVYIYGGVITQLVAGTYFFASYGIFITFLVVLFAACCVASISRICIENPALRIKRVFNAKFPKGGRV
jgi:peptidoglycan/LPS O-acetylase OafA/YrhL